MRIDQASIEHWPTLSPTAWLSTLQLFSPNLPVGGFGYSQGLEWACEQGWVSSYADTEQWIDSQLSQQFVQVELPVVKRLDQYLSPLNTSALTHWLQWLNATRDTEELRLEEKHRAQAYWQLLQSWQVNDLPCPELMQQSHWLALAWLAKQQQIPLPWLALGIFWTQLDAQVSSAMKLVPLGQSQGQQLLLHFQSRLPNWVEKSLCLADSELGQSGPRQAIASAQHRYQYSRLYRS